MEDFLIAAKERPFTVRFSDIYMSGANGIETARELRTFDSDALAILLPLLRIMLWMGSKVLPCTTFVKPYPENEFQTLIDRGSFLVRIPENT